MGFMVARGQVVGGGGGKTGESPPAPKSPFPQELARRLRYHFITTKVKRPLIVFP